MFQMTEIIVRICCLIKGRHLQHLEPFVRVVEAGVSLNMGDDVWCWVGDILQELLTVLFLLGSCGDSNKYHV